MIENLPFRAGTPWARLVKRPPKGVAMHAAAGDRLHFPGRTVGVPDHTAIIIETRGEAGAPPYFVRRDNGHETLVFPGADVWVEHVGEGNATDD